MIRKIVTYFPLALVLTLFLWPNIMAKMDDKSFPVIGVAGFSIRITEIIFFGVAGMLLMGVHKANDQGRITIVFSRRLRIVYGLLALGVIWVICATVQGIMLGNPIVMLDLRGILYSGFVIVFVTTVRSIEQIKKAFKIFYASLVVLAAANLLQAFSASENTIGAYSNITIMMTLFLYSLSLAFSIYFKKNRTFFLLMSLLAFLSCIASLQKQALLGVLVGLIIVGFLVEKSIRKRILRVGLLGLAILSASLYFLISSSNLFMSIFGFSPELYVSNRLLREDVGDISGGRFDMWSQIVHDAVASPLIGKGMGVEGFTFDTIEIPVHEHNIIMWSLRRFSIAGTLVFVALAFQFFLFCRSVYKKETDTYKKALLLGCISYGLIFFVTNMVIILPFVFEPAIIFWLCGSIVFIIHREQLIAENKLTIKH